MYLCCFFWYVNFFARKSDRVSFLTNLKSGWGLYKLFFTPKSDFWYPKTYSTTLDTFGILKHSTSLWTNHWHLELEFLTTRWNLIKPCHPDSKTFQFGKKNALFWSRLWKCDGSFMPLFANQPLKSQWHMLLRVDIFISWKIVLSFLLYIKRSYLGQTLQFASSIQESFRQHCIDTFIQSSIRRRLFHSFGNNLLLEMFDFFVFMPHRISLCFIVFLHKNVSPTPDELKGTLH